MDEVEDGKIEVIGPDIDTITPGSQMNLGIVVEVAAAACRPIFESLIERQLHHFLNYAMGVLHMSQRDLLWIRLNKAAFASGFRLKHFGSIIHARIHDVYGKLVDKVQVTVLTDDAKIKEALVTARKAYNERDARIADMTDESVDEFYSCSLCQSFAPNHICVVSPERLGLCGAVNWLDGKAGYKDRSDGRKPARPARTHHRSRPRGMGRDQRIRLPAFQPDDRADEPVLPDGRPDDLLRLFRVHPRPGAGGQRVS